ncbi:MAG: SRPBCC family protein [Thermoleophilia bacterium]
MVTVVVPAGPRPVWDRWTGFAGWADWNPHCVSAAIDGPLAPGSRLDLHLRAPSGRDFYTRPKVTEAAPGERIAWEARGLGLRARTVTTLTPEPDGTRVTLESDVAGGLAFTYRIALGDKVQALMYVGMLDALTDSLRP